MRKRIALTLALFIGCIAVVVSAGCVSSGQVKTVKDWGATYYQVERERGSARKPVPASYVVARIGQPDYVLPAARLADAIPADATRDRIVTFSARALPAPMVDGKSPQAAMDTINGCSIWFYDEAARYALASQPASFWGMGTGYQVLLFVVDGRGEIIAQDMKGFAKPVSPSHRGKK